MGIEEYLEQRAKTAATLPSYAFLLGLWFVLEYVQLVAAAHNLNYAVFRTPMMLLTPILLFYLVYRIRQKYWTKKFSRMQGWYYCVKISFFAGLIDASFSLILNKWIMPNNLVDMYNSLLAQYQEVVQLMQKTNMPQLANLFSQTADALSEAPIETPVNAAINLLSTDVSTGMIIGIVIAFILRLKERKDQEPVQINDNNNQE